MRYSIMLILLSLLTACQISSKDEQGNDVSENDTCVAITPEKVTSSQSSQEEDSAIIKRYRTFNLFTMQGSGICENYSCVKVTQKKDTLIVETLYPEKCWLKFINMKDYWYSHHEYNMDGSSIYKSVPMTCDIFVSNNTIYEYRQEFYVNCVSVSLKIVKPNFVEEYFLGDSIRTKNRQITFSRILDIIDKKDEFDYKGASDLIRDELSLRMVSRKTGETETFTFPELQILGLTGGLYFDE